MFLDKRKEDRRIPADRRDWQERRSSVRRRFVKDVDEDRRSGLELRQLVRRMVMRRSGYERRKLEFSFENSF